MDQHTLSASTPSKIPPFFGLIWGFKSEFINYLNSLPDGNYQAVNGATEFEEKFYFPFLVKHSIPDQQLAFQGQIEFGGHAGALYVGLSNPIILITNSSASLMFRDPSVPAEQATEVMSLELSLYETSADRLVFRGCNVRLRGEAISLFNGFYQPGAPFADVYIVLPVACFS